MTTAAKTSKSNGKTGLGRGLGALLGDAPSPRAETATQTGLGDAKQKAPITLPIEFLIANPDQPRRVFNEDALAELAASIAARGVLQPILVRPRGKDEYEIVAGERRWRAAQRAKLHEVPVVIRTLNDTEAAEIALIENVQRVDLNPVEEAQAYERLTEQYKRTQEQIAKAVGKSRSHVANIMRLLTLPPRSLESLKAGEISMGHARALLACEDPDAALDLVLARQLSVRETEKLGREAKPTSAAKPAAPKSAPARPKDADTRSLESDIAAALGLEVSIEHNKSGAGSVTINYLTLDQLDDVCRRLMGVSV